VVGPVTGVIAVLPSVEPDTGERPTTVNGVNCPPPHPATVVFRRALPLPAYPDERCCGVDLVLQVMTTLPIPPIGVL